jgi:3alpha(or 20beta)-hydroxysteroid dehydrogenase
MERVTGKVALITGAARGMGAEHARLFVEEGAQVVIGDILDDAGQALAEELGENARYIHLDVTDSSDWAAAVDLAVSTFGHLDVLVNNAAVATFASVEETSIELWQKTIAVNLTGTFRGIQAALPALKLSGSSSIVNISSTAAFVGYEGLSVYNASKWGIRGLTKSVALDMAKHGIRVNSVHPGVIKTPLSEGLSETPSHTAMHRMGQPREVSYMVLFLASDESTYCTGAEYLVDGGEIAGLSNLIALSRTEV